MSKPEIKAGDTFKSKGINVQIRIVSGRKGDGDLVAQMLTRDGWQAIRMDMTFFLTDFFHQNETRLYPNGKKGEFYMERLQLAKEKGFQAAINKLNEEKERARQKRRKT